MPASRSATTNTVKERIVAAASRLLTEGGPEAVSTRAVSAAAGVQAPTIYRLFGDKQGLLDFVAARGLAVYLDDKTDLTPGYDPVENLRMGWDLHVSFGLANPALYALIYGGPRPGTSPPAAVAAAKILAEQVHRIAEVGRLRVAEERAARLVYAAGCGTTLTLISMPEDQCDLTLSDLAREAVIAAITTDAPTPALPGPVGAATALRAVLPQTSVLSGPEQALLQEWLERLTKG